MFISGVANSLRLLVNVSKRLPALQPSTPDDRQKADGSLLRVLRLHPGEHFCRLEENCKSFKGN